MEQNKAASRLGEEKISRLLLSLALPTVLAQLVNLLYNVVDRIYIGHIKEIGAAALTGVGLCAPVIIFISAFSMLACSGGAPRASIFMGKKDYAKAERILGNCFSLVIIFAVLITIFVSVFASPLLRLFGASDVTLVYALDYARIYILGSIFIMIVMGMNPFITAQGFSTFSMLTTLIGAVTNIILDPVFIFVFNMGVKGAAFATVISQAVSCIWAVSFLRGKKTVLKLKLSEMKPSFEIVGPCLALGIAPFVMMSTESILSVSFTSSLAKYGGDLAVGAMTLCTSINSLLLMPLTGLTQGGQPIISYNYGAGNKERVKKAFFLVFGICIGVSTLYWLAIRLFPGFFIGIFSSDEALKEKAVWALKIFTSVAFVSGFQLSCQQTFVALGQAKISLLMACLRKLILLIPLIFILPLFFADKTFAVFLAEPVSDFVAAAVTTLVFFATLNKILNKEIIK